MKTKFLILLRVTGVIILLRENSVACSVCQGGNSIEKTSAYLFTTGLLCILPILMATALFIFIRKANRKDSFQYPDNYSSPAASSQ
jgi:hypothetical protein